MAVVDKRVERIIRVRANMLMDLPFFGLLASRLVPKEDPGCATFWTDAVSFGFNPKFMDSLLDVELKGMLAKAVLHIAAGHPWRQDSREGQRWNEACTQAVLPLLTKSKLHVPKGLKANPDFAGLACEAIYVKLPPAPEPPEPSPDSSQGEEGEQEDPSSGAQAAGGSGQDDASGDDDGKSSEGEADGEGNSDGADSDGSSGPSTSPPQGSQGKLPPVEVRPAPADVSEEKQGEWQMAMATATRMQGNMPLGAEQLFAGLLSPSVDWKEELRNFFEQSMALQDYSWTRPNIRYISQGLYLPSLQGQGIPAVVIARDTSGSIDEQYLIRFNSEIADVMASVKPEVLYVLDIDAEVQRVQEFEAGADEMDLDQLVKGRGGTAFEPAFEWVQAQGIDCKALLYLTDMEGSFPDEAPEYPTLWVVPEGTTRGKTPPFGQLLEIEL